MWRKLFKLFGFKVARIETTLGDVLYRFAKHGIRDKYVCTVYTSKAVLYADGRFDGPCYMEDWDWA